MSSLAMAYRINHTTAVMLRRRRVAAIHAAARASWRELAAVDPDPDPAVATDLRTLPLAGDVVAELARRIGADRAAAWISSKLGVDCGCAERRARLNRLDQKLRRWFGWNCNERTNPNG